MVEKITKCRICGNTNLLPIINLGVQALTGVFPKRTDEKIQSGPLELVKCEGDNCCNLLQLRHTFDLDEMYGFNYGYRSGLNISMLKHLKNIYDDLANFVSLEKDDLIIDIGSNDGTFLKFFETDKYTLAGIDPTIKKFKNYYPDSIVKITDFFSALKIKSYFGDRKAKIVTSFAMFYDLLFPLKFVQDIESILSDDGIWVFEQSYMPYMLQNTAYDTICHEHFEYYGINQIKWMVDRAGLKIIDVELNDTNGGSFKLVVAKNKNTHCQCVAKINKLLTFENAMGLHTFAPYEKFKKQVFEHRDKLIAKIEEIRSENKTLFGYGASTKGNVILQFCGFTKENIQCIAEVNQDKFGAFTPATNIPIISEIQAKEMKPDYFLVLPWHFRDNIIMREKEIINSGTKFIFPLPAIEVVDHV